MFPERKEKVGLGRGSLSDSRPVRYCESWDPGGGFSVRSMVPNSTVQTGTERVIRSCYDGTTVVADLPLLLGSRCLITVSGLVDSEDSRILRG